MSATSVVVATTAAMLTLPMVRAQGPRRLPASTTDGTVVPGRRGYIWHASHLAAAPFVALVAVGPISALVVGILVAGLYSQVRGWSHRAAARRVERELPVVLHDIARRLRAGDPAGLAFAEALGAAKGAVRGSYAASMLMRGEPLSAATARWHIDVSCVVRPNILDDLVHVVVVAERVGGLRASAVEAVADLASERRALAQETEAQASQAKASATVMTIAPLVFSAQMVLRDPVASRLLLHTPVGWALICTGLSFDVAAWLWIRRATAGGRMHAPTSALTRRPTHPVLSAIRSVLVRQLVVGVGPERRLIALADCRSAQAGPPRVPLLELVGTAVERSTVVLQGSVDAVRVRPRGSPTSTAWTTEQHRRMGLAVIVLPPLVFLRPWLGVLAIVVVAVGPKLHATIARHRQHRERIAAVGHTIELLRSALECGTTPSVALLVVAEVDASALRPALQGVAADLRQGAPFDEAMRRLIVSAPELRAMADVLLASSRLGLPVVETLRGLAVEARASRRRDAEARARRLPVVLLFPVVCLTLPAFVLLTVAPLLLSGLGALHL